jgi:ankyrin repeat protein
MHVLSEADIETKGDILNLAHLLLEHGAEVNRRDCDNETPLHTAIRWDLYKLAGILLEHGADANAVNIDGETPLRILSEALNYDDSEGDFVNHAQLVLKYVTRMDRRDRRDEDNNLKISSILGIGR